MYFFTSSRSQSSERFKSWFRYQKTVDYLNIHTSAGFWCVVRKSMRITTKPLQILCPDLATSMQILLKTIQREIWTSVNLKADSLLCYFIHNAWLAFCTLFGLKQLQTRNGLTNRWFKDQQCTSESNLKCWKRFMNPSLQHEHCYESFFAAWAPTGWCPK